MNGFWLTPGCLRIYCAHHYQTAIEIVGDFPPAVATEKLLERGYVRCVISEGNLFHERRLMLTDRQVNTLSEIASDLGLSFYPDRPRVIRS